MRKVLGLSLVIMMVTIMLCVGALAEGTTDASLLLPASSAAPLPEDYEPGDLKQISSGMAGIHLVTSRSMTLREEALNALYRLAQAAEDDGVTLYVRQAYRSYADEARRYDLLVSMGSEAQKPGESSYQTGLSVTLVGENWKTQELTEDFASSAESQWLSQHAAEYGFVLRYPAGKENVTGWHYEPWHYRYVGVQTAAELTAKGQCLDELSVNAAAIIALPQLSKESETDEPEEPAEEADIDEDVASDDDAFGAFAVDDESDEDAEPDEEAAEAEDAPDGDFDAEDEDDFAADADDGDEPDSDAGDGNDSISIGFDVDASLLLPASAEVPLPRSYEPDDLKQISSAYEGVHLVTSRNMTLREEALESLYRLMRAAEADGRSLYVRQAYRSYAEEERRYELLISMDEETQKPGESSYQTGLSVTLVGENWKTQELTEDFASSAESQWLSQHAAEYGFVLRYPAGKEDVTGWRYEPWHYRYVGKEAAVGMIAQNLCLDELAAALGIVGDEAATMAEDEEPEQPVARKEHSVPPVIDLSGIPPEDFGPDGDYDISIFGN